MHWMTCFAILAPVKSIYIFEYLDMHIYKFLYVYINSNALEDFFCNSDPSKIWKSKSYSLLSRDQYGNFMHSNY